MSSQTILVGSSYTVVSDKTVNNNVVQTDRTPTIIVGGIMGPPGPAGSNSSVSASTDVDVSNLQDGSALIWSAASNRWQATTLLEKQVINAGFF
jgi:hypothetical protein